jgi:hypothetical protein
MLLAGLWETLIQRDVGMTWFSLLSMAAYVVQVPAYISSPLQRLYLHQMRLCLSTMVM